MIKSSTATGVQFHSSTTFTGKGNLLHDVVELSSVYPVHLLVCSSTLLLLLAKGTYCM